MDTVKLIRKKWPEDWERKERVPVFLMGRIERTERIQQKKNLIEKGDIKDQSVKGLQRDRYSNFDLL